MFHYFWFLQANHGIEVDDAPSFFADELKSFFEQYFTVYILQIFIRIRKMNTDIAEAESAQQGVANGMQKYIGVTMANGAFAMRNFNTTQK
jgi:hypothetical protein